jgi:hypothetical protein
MHILFVLLIVHNNLCRTASSSITLNMICLKVQRDKGSLFSDVVNTRDCLGELHT